MAQKRLLVWALGFAAALLLTGAVLAQVSTNFDLSWHLLSGGGGSRSSTQYQVDDSLGQWAAQPSSSATYEIAPGFWYGVGQPEPGWHDDYEMDDNCGLATTITTDGSIQPHTFHDEGDEDWVKFQAQANRTYIIEVNNLGDNVDAVVMLHSLCESPPLASEHNAFGPTVRMSWNCRTTGEYYVGLVQNDPSLYGEGTDYHLSITVDTEPPSPPRSVRVDPATGALNVQWSESPEPDVAGYGVRWGTTSGGPYSFHPVDGADNTFYQIPDLITGQPYYIVLTAFDFSDNESDPSVEVGGIPGTPPDTTSPAVTLDRPSAQPVYSTTVAALTIGGTCTDASANLSRVRVYNAQNSAEGWAYNLAGGSAPFMVESIPLAIGDNEIQVTAYDSADNTGSGSMTIRRLSGLNGAVVIAGGRNNTASLQSNINHATSQAYRVFRAAGFGAEDIYYLSHGPQDADGDGLDDVDAATTNANLEAAIQWATARVGPGIPFFLYLMDHGGVEAFCADGCTLGGRIESEELDGWLDTLEDSSGCDSVNIIIEACHSGSFVDRVDGIAKSLSEDGRVVIASTGRTNNAYASAQGAYFSDAFFSAVAEGGDLLTCFNQAKTAVEVAGVPQTPWMDDNGDGLYTAPVDGTYAGLRYVASYFGTLLPEITASTVTISDGEGSIEAQVLRGDEPVQVVWAAVYAPSFQAPTETTLDLGVPLLQLELDPEQEGVYSTHYNAFGEEGAYRVVIYAQDSAGNQAPPRVVRTLETVYLPIVLRNQGGAGEAATTVESGTQEGEPTVQPSPEPEVTPEPEDEPGEGPMPEPAPAGEEWIFLPLVVRDDAK
jgi:hypothetical protein